MSKIKIFEYLRSLSLEFSKGRILMFHLLLDPIGLIIHKVVLQQALHFLLDDSFFPLQVLFQFNLLQLLTILSDLLLCIFYLLNNHLLILLLRVKFRIVVYTLKLSTVGSLCLFIREAITHLHLELGIFSWSLVISTVCLLKVERILMVRLKFEAYRFWRCFVDW